MKPLNKQDKQFFWKALGTAVVVMALLKCIAPFLQGPDPRAADIAAFAKEVKSISAHDVREKLSHGNGKPVMLVLYASWCVPCQHSMPDVVALVRSHELDNITPLFISLDKSPEELSGYLIHHDYKGLFPPVMLKTTDIEALQASLALADGHFSGIPYTGFYDLHGKAVAEFNGIVDKERLLDMAGSLRR